MYIYVVINKCKFICIKVPRNMNFDYSNWNGSDEHYTFDDQFKDLNRGAQLLNISLIRIYVNYKF